MSLMFTALIPSRNEWSMTCFHRFAEAGNHSRGVGTCWSSLRRCLNRVSVVEQSMQTRRRVGATREETRTASEVCTEESKQCSAPKDILK